MIRVRVGVNQTRDQYWDIGAVGWQQVQELFDVPAELAELTVEKIRKSQLITEPFPHILIEELFPAALYARVMREFPPRSEMTKVDYPGTGQSRKCAKYHDYGYAYPQFHRAGGALGLLRSVLASPQFERALLDKFQSRPEGGETPIPVEKHEAFSAGAHDYTTVFDLQVDLPGYEIPPHKDVPVKIVTFQLHLAEDGQLSDYGTLLCRPKKAGSGGKRPLPARMAANVLKKVVKLRPLVRWSRTGWRGAIFRRFERSQLGVLLGAGEWLRWEDFEVVKVAPALPNHFFAFAPNDKSFHAVRFDPPPGGEVQERRVVRGFIMRGRNAKNLLRPRS